MSLMSAKGVMAALARHFDVVPIGLDRQGRFVLGDDPLAFLEAGGEGGTLDEIVPGLPGPSVQAVLKTVDIVFPVLHGPYGEDGTIQGLLELAGIPYVGSGVLGSAVGMDKGIMKMVFQQAGLPVVPWVLVRASDWRASPEGVRRRLAPLGYPLFVKPANMGSSIGISKVCGEESLAAALAVAFRYDRRVVVEKGLEARELECAVLGNDEPEASLVGEIIPAHEFYDYEAKYVEGSQTVVPAALPRAVAEAIQDYARRAFLAVDAAGLARVDFFYTQAGEVFVNEINTIPGFTPYSMYPKMWEASGLSYEDLVAKLVALGLERARGKERQNGA